MSSIQRLRGVMACCAFVGVGCGRNDPDGGAAVDAATSDSHRGDAPDRGDAGVLDDGGVPSSGHTTLAIGYAHTCAVTATGGVRCWGSNYPGQLGTGSTLSSSVPLDVTGLTSGVVSVSAGGQSTCALTTGGGVKCWGSNGNGRLGDGTDTTRTTPVDVVGLTSGVAQLAAGWAHVCVLTTAGGVKCWGENLDGQLGDGSEDNSRFVPVDVVGLSSGVVQITARGNHSCALMAAGSVKCWGDNDVGQLGDATETDRPLAVDVIGLSGVAQVEAGSVHTCALLVGGDVKCSGHNTYGQLGNGEHTNRSTAVAASSLQFGVARLAVGGHDTCVVTLTGGAKCWGYNFYGQLGDGTKMDRDVPVDVVGMTAGVVELVAGYRHSCARTASGVKCWGWNEDGQLGDGSMMEALTPVAVTGL